MNTKIPKNMPLLIKSIWVLAAPLFIASANIAEARNPLQPYHVEVIVFAQQDFGSGSRELPRSNLALAYPPNYRVIAPEPEVVAGEIVEAGSSPSLHASAQDNKLSNEAANNPGDGQTMNLQSMGNKGSISPWGIDSDTQEIEYNPLRILYERPTDSYQLNKEARALSSRNNYQVLFHKAWQQVFSDGPNEPYIVITGGGRFDERTELGGTLKLYINKYIHLESNLWLADFEPNLGQESEYPLPPIAPTGFAAKPGDGEANSELLSFSPPTSYLGLGPGTSSHTAPNLYGLATSNSQAQYITSRIVELKQSRRMRSKELHYLDHPHLGILIRIDPIEFDEASSTE